MITRKEIDLAAPLTTPQIEMLTALAAAPSTADVDCPELTAAQQNSFYRLIRNTDSRFISCDTDTSKKQRPFLKQSPINFVINLYIVNILYNVYTLCKVYTLFCFPPFSDRLWIQPSFFMAISFSTRRICLSPFIDFHLCRWATIRSLHWDSNRLHIFLTPSCQIEMLFLRQPISSIPLYMNVR